MIIVVKGADFSENKIGIVVIPRDSLNVTTTEILSHYTKTLTDTVKYALDDLIIALNVNNIWDKVTHAYFPCIANSVAEALYEAKGKTELSGLVNASTIAITGYVLDSYGLKTASWVSGDGLSTGLLNYTYGVNANSNFQAVLLKKIGTVGYISAIGSEIHLSAATKMLRLGDNVNNITKVSTVTESQYERIIGNVKKPGNSENTIAISLNGVTSYTFTSAGSYVNTNLVRTKIGVANSDTYGQYFYNTSPVAVQLIGSELTDSQVTILDNLLKNFNDKLIL